jgi:ferredoxin
VASPYEILDVDPDADDEAVMHAYRERVMAAHPDQGGSVREFQRVQHAYEQIQAGWEDDDEASAAADDGSDWAVDADETTGSKVEYLNYDVLADHGWDLSDDDLFEKAATADLDATDHGEFVVDPNDKILETAEKCGFAWPFACRGGACTNCAICVVDGEVPPPANHILPPEMIDRGIRLSCVTRPSTDEAKIVYNVKHLPGVNELLLPASRFEATYPTD